MSRWQPRPDEEDPRIRQLETDLYLAREFIISLAPRTFRQLLESYSTCATRQSTYGWQDAIAEKIVKATEPIPQEGFTTLGVRAYCPLCHRGAKSYYGSEGFAYPEGIRRHLVGYGRTRQCGVMEAALAQARDCWSRSFEAGGASERVRQEVTSVPNETQKQGRPGG